MENRSLVKIQLTHKDTGLPAVGYSVDLLELDSSNAEMVSDENGNIVPFYMDLNNFIYADISVRDEDDNVVTEAEGQFPLASPETIIHIQF